MISWVEGELREKYTDHVVVNVNGVGYELLISLSTFGALPDVGKTLSMFATAEERAIFELLLKANRIGPKLAQTILSGIEPQRILAALRDGDIEMLSSAPGVGKKMAERMVVELREKAGELAAGSMAVEGLPPSIVPIQDADSETREQALSALLNLGYPKAQAERVVDSAASSAGEGASLEELIRHSLRRLAR
jgi:Holliday junction DNA helicase RuvA